MVGIWSAKLRAYRPVGSNFSLGRRGALLSDEIVAVQWRAQRADREAEQLASAQSASHRRVCGPSPRKILNLRPSEIVSGAILE